MITTCLVDHVLPDLALAWYNQLIFTNIFTKLSTVTRGQLGKKCKYYSTMKFDMAGVCAAKTDLVMLSLEQSVL